MQDYATRRPRSKLHYIRSKQSKGQVDSAYVKVETAIPKHSDTTFEFYADSTIDVQINNYNGTALIDSGATMSLIDSRLVASLIPNAKAIMAKYTPQFSGITSVTGQRSPILGVLPLLIKIGKFVFKHMTHVIANLGTQMILGRDFLQAHKCTLNFDNNSLRSRTLCKLYTPKKVHIPARSAATFSVRMYGPRWRPNGLIMDISKRTIRPGVHVTSSLSRNLNGYVTTHVQNDNDAPVHFKSGTKISYARPCSSI